MREWRADVRVHKRCCLWLRSAQFVCVPVAVCSIVGNNAHYLSSCRYVTTVPFEFLRLVLPADGDTLGALGALHEWRLRLVYHMCAQDMCL